MGRTEAGYCAIQWKESSTTSPDPFEFGVSPPAAVWTTAAAGGASTTLCEQYVLIPGLSPDGTTKIPAPPGVQAFQSQMCGEFFGLEHAIASEGVISMALVSQSNHLLWECIQTQTVFPLQLLVLTWITLNYPADKDLVRKLTIVLVMPLFGLK